MKFSFLTCLSVIAAGLLLEHVVGGSKGELKRKSAFHDSRNSDTLHWRRPSRSSFSGFCVSCVLEISGIHDRGLT